MTPRTYKRISLGLAVIFGIVGLIFLFMSSDVLLLFNRISGVPGMEEAVPGGHYFYVILAVAYMYCVTVLAFLMYRSPDTPAYPLLLFNGKFASAIVSVLFFVFERHLLIYLTNGIVDGLIGVLVVAMHRSIKRASR